MPADPPTLTAEQTHVVEAIWNHDGPATHLLFGVTGAGKTEVYLQLLMKTLAQEKRGLILVPEIALTPQLLARFTARFGNNIAILHSQLTDRDRTIEWWKIQAGEKKILLGARSALFCPIPNLGLIVVDEEHEPSFKQDEKLRYQARDSAVMMGHQLKCPVILGSATPSLESWLNAKTGKYNLHTLTKRATEISMPEIEIIDLRRHKEIQKESGDKGSFWGTPKLLEAIQTRLDRGEQSALFLNRRGMAQSVICPSCGARKECPNCSISLTLHAKTHLLCHYCDYQESLTERCLACGEGEPRPIGLGTELVEKELAQTFPTARLIRADRDEIQKSPRT